MKQKQIHTPEGVRDIYNIEYRKKLVLQNRLHRVLHAYGYHDIQTPTFEFFDVFRKEIGTISSKELYKFFDREGNTLALRPDITPSIARAAATLYADEELPIRLCYMGNTFINHSSYQGRLKETTQLGAELIGDDSVEADAEMIALVVDCLKEAGLKEFQINIGNVEFFQSLIADAELEEDMEFQLRELISNRNFFGVDELLHTVNIKDSTLEAFSLLPELVGTDDILETAKKIAPNANALKAVKRLAMIYELLTIYGVDKYVTFDLSMSGTYGYYTGIIFRAYTFGTGDAIVKGGRYDHLIEKFGKESPSTGFAIVVDELMSALSRQKISIPCRASNTILLYDEDRRKEAVLLARKFRREKKNIELLCKDAERAVESYIDYGKRNMAGCLLYLRDTEEVMMVNLLTDEVKFLKNEE